MESTTPQRNDVAYDAHPFDLGAIIRLTIIGVVSGVTGWLLYLLLSQYVIEPVFCQSTSTYAVCRNGGTIAWVSAHVVTLAAALAILAKQAVYRPLLIVLAVFISLWAAHSWLSTFPWYLGLAWQALLFGLAFAIFGWVARASNFIFALVATIAVVVIARLALMAA